MMGAVQAVIALGLGISSVVGLLVFITYTLPGIAIDAILCTDFLCKIQMKTRMMLAGGAGVLTGAAFTNMLYFNLSVIPFILFYIFGILSGALGGYMAFIIMESLPESIKSRGKQI